ncbi:MAG: EF-hand domain-containing protein [Candidatus Marithrix sp.]|nr:EF-hand domain-containing protein [Candidatus Marithrix sp.]
MKTIIVLSSAIVLSLAANITSARNDGGQNADRAQMQETRMQARVVRLMGRFDVNQDEQITLDEVQSVRTANFNQIDVDGNGLINAEELNSYKTAMRAQNSSMQEQRGGKGRNANRTDNIERLDNDGDGQISASEFSANIPLFDRFDADENGIITKEELSQRPNRR